MASRPKLRVESFTISLDGYGAGVGQSLELPMGKGGFGLHPWAFKTRTFRRMFGQKGGSIGVDDSFARRGFDNVGANILGRNMFSPSRGPWPDDDWKGWWGANPPYHSDTFILTHHPRDPITMEGGTVFHFVTDGIEAALSRAMASAKGKDVRLGGGAATVRQYLQAGLIDEMHVVISPVFLGAGESLFAGVDFTRSGLELKRHVATANATHLLLERP
jgi:dihydrofolate reductase